MLRRCMPHDFEEIWAVVNDGAQAYKGVIPGDRWSEPYMPREKLRHEIDHGVIFWGVEEAGALAGVMGIQQVRDVTLVRHAYVRTRSQKSGIGATLLAHLRGQTDSPFLIGTWADAAWAIRFYEKHGFHKLGAQDKDKLLDTYWSIPRRQREASVVLADEKWREINHA